MTTSAAAYLLCELAFRPIAARALAQRGVDREGVPGVATRWLLTWAVGTGVPVFGLLLVGIVALTSVQIAEQALAVTIIALCTIGLVFGAVVSVLAAYATVHPIRSIRQGLSRVQQGDLDVEVGVWDSTEMACSRRGSTTWSPGCASARRSATCSAARSARTSPSRRSTTRSAWAERPAR